MAPCRYPPGGEIASAMGMDFEQALKVHQGRMAGACDRPGAFLPCLRQGLHGVDGRAHVKDKGLPWLRADAQGRIQHNSTWLLSIMRLGLAYSTKWTRPRNPQAVAKEPMKVA